MSMDTVSPLRQRMIEDMNARRLGAGTQRGHIREPQKIPQVMSPDETRRVLAVATSLKARVALSLCYGCGLRAGEVVRLKVKHIDKAQRIIRIEQSKGRKDRHVMLSPKMLDLLRQWWKVRPTRWDTGVPLEERWLFPGRKPGKPMTYPPVEPPVPRDSRRGRDQEERDAACAAAQLLRPTCSKTTLISESSRHCSEGRHTAH